MKKIIFLLIAALIISNVIWGYLYFKVDHPAVHVYNLKGTGEMWDITDYKIIVTPSNILRGHGKLAYKGDPKNFEKITYYQMKFEELNLDGNYDIVYMTEASSKEGTVAIPANLNDIGSITREYSYNEPKKDIHNYNSTTLTITWNDNDGKLHSESIRLSIENEINLDYTTQPKR